MKLFSAVGCSFLLNLVLAIPFALAHQTSPRPDGGVNIKCDSGRTAVAILQGTILMIEVTEPDSSKWNKSEEPSGGSSDPGVVIGNGSNLANNICSS